MEHRLRQIFRRVMLPKALQLALPSLAQRVGDGGALSVASPPQSDHRGSTDTRPLLI